MATQYTEANIQAAYNRLMRRIDIAIENNRDIPSSWMKLKEQYESQLGMAQGPQVVIGRVVGDDVLSCLDDDRRSCLDGC